MCLIGSNYVWLEIKRGPSVRRVHTSPIFTALDVADIEAFRGVAWYAWINKRTGAIYAHAGFIGLHRYLLLTSGVAGLSYGSSPKLCVDHLNGNTLDNRRGNLRVLTNLENGRHVWPYTT